MVSIESFKVEFRFQQGTVKLGEKSLSRIQFLRQSTRHPLATQKTIAVLRCSMLAGLRQVILPI